MIDHLSDSLPISDPEAYLDLVEYRFLKRKYTEVEDRLDGLLASMELFQTTEDPKVREILEKGSAFLKAGYFTSLAMAATVAGKPLNLNLLKAEVEKAWRRIPG